VKVLLVVCEVDDGVADELAGPVIGDVAAALHLVQFHAAGRESFGRFDHAGFPRAAAESDHTGMLEEEQEVVGERAADPRPRQPTL
jgi:hypothetical protein